MNMSWNQNLTNLYVELNCIQYTIPNGNSGRVYDPQHPFIREGRERSNGCEWSGHDFTY
jgi:hypothetical protein